MTKTAKTIKTHTKPDGTIITEIRNQTFVNDVYFDHDSKETFQGKLMRAMLAEESYADRNS